MTTTGAKVTLVDHRGRPLPPTPKARPSTAPRLRAGYDAAQTTTENRKLWQDTDALGPVAALTPAVRRTLRDRARYEAANNCYMAGVVRTVVGDTVGTGPRLQMLSGDAKLDAEVESLWRLWAAAADWPLTARVLVGVECLVGECFGVFRDSKRLARLGLPVTLDVKLIEPEQVASPFGAAALLASDDGIVTDADGDPTHYQILKAHPGESFALNSAADKVDAANVIHWFQPTRPGQLRGVSGLVPALPIFAQLRRFSMATLTAAEVAAMLAGVLESQLAPETDNGAYPLQSEESWFDTFDLVRGMLLTLPPGTKANQFKPEQPTTNYEMFVSAKLREIGRCINMPFGKVAGDHSRYNYSSARMDDAPYWSDRDIHRQGLEAKVFDPVLYKWFEFAKFAIPALLRYDGGWWQVKHAWQYPARPVSDPVKDATGDELNLTNGTDDLESIAAREGTTAAALLDARARVRDLYVARNLPLPPWLGGAPGPARAATGRPGAPPAQVEEGDGAEEVTEEPATEEPARA